MNARIVQAKRHLWGSLDTAYAMRKALLLLISPSTQGTIDLKNTHVDKLGKSKEPSMQPYTIFTLFHRLLEAHVLMGQLFLIVTIGSFVIPETTSTVGTWSAWIWSHISTLPASNEIYFALDICFWIRLFALMPNILMIGLYEAYHQWVGFERWALQDAQQDKLNLKNYLGDLKLKYKSAFTPSRFSRGITVQHLGKRASLAAPREKFLSLFDWCVIPVSGFLFYVMPQCIAQLTHLYTNKLDYKVAAKPQLGGRNLVDMVDDVKSVGSKGGDEGFFEEDDNRVQSPSK